MKDFDLALGSTAMTSMTYREKMQEICEDSATSDWLFYAIFALASRDPADALQDVKKLMELQTSRVDDTAKRS